MFIGCVHLRTYTPVHKLAPTQGFRYRMNRRRTKLTNILWRGKIFCLVKNISFGRVQKYTQGFPSHIIPARRRNFINKLRSFDLCHHSCLIKRHVIQVNSIFFFFFFVCRHLFCTIVHAKYDMGNAVRRMRGSYSVKSGGKGREARGMSSLLGTLFRPLV